MDKEEKRLREEIGSLVTKQEEIVANAKKEDRPVSKEEGETFDGYQEEIEGKRAELNRHLKLKENKNDMDSTVALGEEKETKVVAKVGPAKAESEEAMYHHTANIFRALTAKGPDKSNSPEIIKASQKELYVGGHYDGLGIKASVDGFNTLVDKDGGIFLPTTISDQILEIERQYGAFPSNSLRVPLTPGGGKQVLPNVLGKIKFYATNQGSEAKASRFSFSGLSLEDLKWMAWIAWTNEMGSAAGQKLVGLIMRKLGEASAEVKDDAAINADGSSGYHNLKGVIFRSGSADFPEVRLSTAATGNNAFDKIDESDFSKARLDVAPSVRSGGIYVLHTDWEVLLTQIKDNEGRPLYLSGGAISMVNGQWFIYGHRVVFTEAMANEDGASKPFGIFYNPNYFAFGDVGAFVAEEFDQANIPSSDGGDDIKLASQDMRALRIKEFFDYELSQLTVDSGGAKLGAFTVLRTAAS